LHFSLVFSKIWPIIRREIRRILWHKLLDVQKFSEVVLKLATGTDEEILSLINGDYWKDQLKALKMA
jgi:hypothetical protein